MLSKAVAVFRRLILRALRVLVVPNTLDMRRITGSRRILGPDVHRFDHVNPSLLQKAFTDGRTSRSQSNIFSGGATGVLENTDSVSGVYISIYCEYSQCLRVQYS